ncbi:IMPACT family protein [Halomonas denitrificans]|nr:IMPACT family protein [Halomonas denitrificans]
MNRLTGIARVEQTIRKSRFIGVCGPIDGPDDAAAFVAEHGAEGCRHVAFAWRVGSTVRFDDAGEPGGTAGRPILAALEHFDLDRSIAVVSRFFGGVKLGTGGLARAYGGTAMAVLQAAPTAPIVAMTERIVEAGFEFADALHRQVDELGGEKLDEGWTSDGVRLQVRLPEGRAPALERAVREITRGQGSCSAP